MKPEELKNVQTLKTSGTFESGEQVADELELEVDEFGDTKK